MSQLFLQWTKIEILVLFWKLIQKENHFPKFLNALSFSSGREKLVLKQIDRFVSVWCLSEMKSHWLGRLDAENWISQFETKITFPFKGVNEAMIYWLSLTNMKSSVRGFATKRSWVQTPVRILDDCLIQHNPSCNPWMTCYYRSMGLWGKTSVFNDLQK